MTMSIAFLAIFLAAAPAETDESTNDNGRLPTVATVERIPLHRPADGLYLSVDPLSKRLELHSPHNGVTLLQRLRSAGSRICPHLTAEKDSISLQCRTRQLDAILADEHGQAILEIYELRGLPWRDESQQLMFFYDPVALHLGGSCPGATPLVRGECALHEGELAVAAVEFRRALNGDGRRMAAVRLGDLALRQQEPGTAAGWYQVAGRSGIFGRMAAARLCELGGNCLGNIYRNVFDATSLPEPLRSELLLRSARLSAFLGELERSVTLLAQAIRANRGACREGSLLFCRRLLLAAFERPGTDGALEALEAYLALPGRNTGVLAQPLIRVAAEKAAALGAYQFAGNLMASEAMTTGLAEPGTLNEYLLRTAELYLQGGDRARARLLCEFADTRLGRSALTGARWAAVLVQARLPEEEPPVSSTELTSAEATRDLAVSYTALARAARLRQSALDDSPKETP
jgi:hypothetical protein